MRRRGPLRLTLGLSPEASAEKVELGYKYYQTVEAGRWRDLRLSTLGKLAKGCELPPKELLNFDVEQVVLAEDKLKLGAMASRTKSASKVPPHRTFRKGARA